MAVGERRCRERETKTTVAWGQPTRARRQRRDKGPVALHAGDEQAESNERTSRADVVGKNALVKVLDAFQHVAREGMAVGPQLARNHTYAIIRLAPHMGMTTIGLVQRKDDVGTTTIATNLAVTLRNRGDSVLLVDAGPQGRQKGTVRDWSATGDSQTPETIGVDRPVVHEKLPSIEGFDVAIIDATGKLGEMTISAIKASDLTLVPVQPSTADPKKVGQVIDCIETHQALPEAHSNERRPAARFVISRATGSSKMGEQIQQIVSEAPFGRLDAGTSQRVAYARALGEGASVHETGDKEAQAEVKAITDEIEQILRADGQ